MEAHREINYGWIILIFIVPGQILLTYLYFSGIGNNPLSLTPFLLISALFITVTLLFYQLKVTVHTDTILVSFGIGLIWKAIDISRIEEVKVVKNPLYFGWGIRIIPRGTMFNVTGRKAIELAFRDTNRIIRIGSQNPEQLKQAIEERIKVLRPRG